MIKIRGAIFMVIVVVLMMLLWPVAVVGSFVRDENLKFKIITTWGRAYIRLLKLIVGIDFRVSGMENIPEKPCVVFAKHQSSLDIFILLKLFTPQSWILKQELLKIPFFGWSLKLLNPVSINRDDGRNALTKVTKAGAAKINDGFWVVIYPEGTRKPPGTKSTHKRGGVAMAKEAEVDILPVALNTGLFWSKALLPQHSGTVDVVIGKPIKTDTMDSKAISLQAQTWIEDESYALVENHPYFVKPITHKEETNV